MNVWINAHPVELPDAATLADAVAHATAQRPADAPFAVAVNLRFVPRSQYPHTPLHEGDRIEIIAPVTGG